MKKLDILTDFFILAHVTSTCKQDYANCTFFYSLDDKTSLHFSTIAHDYYRLLLIDMHTVLSTSKKDKCTFWKFLNKIDSGRYADKSIDKTHIVLWKEMLLKNMTSIESIKFLRDKKIAHIDQDMSAPIEISMGAIKNLLMTMEHIVLDICTILGCPLDKITTMDEQLNHNILDAFKRIEFDAYYPQLSLEFSPTKAVKEASPMRINT
jgi:hypothetical protein